MAMGHDLSFDSEVPFTHKSSGFKEVNLGQCLELLNELQLTKLIDVVANDYQLKYDLFRKIRKQGVALEEFGKNHLPRSGSCAFCWQTFRLFRREIVCTECPRNVCYQCQVQGLCKYCHEIKVLCYKRSELQILVPFGKDRFGYCKMITLERIGDPSAFQLRSTIELHLSFLLETEIDSQYIMFIITDMDLHFARDKLQKALENFEETSHFNNIDDAVGGIRCLLSGRTSCLFECKSDVEELDYFRLVSHAVIYAIHTKKESDIDPKTSIQRFVSKRLSKRVNFPSILSTDLEHEDFDTNEQWIKSYQCPLSDNWFLKTNKNYVQPIGALRSQSPCSINTNNARNFGRPGMFGKNISIDENSSIHQCNGEDSLDYGNDNSLQGVYFERSPEITSSTGQLVIVRCRIVSYDPELVDILWFNTRRQITNTGRTRIQQSQNEAMLEIFDCDETEDSGELFCVAISDLNICSDVTRIIIHREDLAGEEPEFIEPLSLSHSQSKLFIGGFMVIKTKIRGYPIPYANFFFKNRIVKQSKRFQIEHNGDVWSLYIWNLNAEDEGVYKVAIKNRIGTSFSKLTIKLAKDSQERRNNSFIY